MRDFETSTNKVYRYIQQANSTTRIFSALVHCKWGGGDAMIKKERKIIRAQKKTDPMANRKEVHLEEDDIISTTATQM